MGVDEIIERLGLEPHPEGGWYRRTWAHPDVASAGEPAPGTATARPGRPDGAGAPAGRPLGSAILYLLPAGERSHWHVLDAHELWHHHAGDPLELELSDDAVAVRTLVLGSDLVGGQLPQLHVPAGVWQSARSLGAWTLVGCSVVPAFDFAGFTLAPPGWRPGTGPPELPTSTSS